MGKEQKQQSEDGEGDEDEAILFGGLALKLGYVSKEQLRKALAIQKKLEKQGKNPPRIGEILVQKGFMSEEEAQSVFRLQGIKGGHTNIEGYEILEKIGQGSMGNVYRAKQLSMDRTVALKILSPDLAKDEKFVERFFREARSVARLNHPKIMQGIDVGESNGVHYFVMEYLDGPTVGDIVRRGGAMDQRRAIHIAEQISQALEHASEHDLVHRDIKPDNIMMTSSGTAKLCDLGLAKVISDDKEENKKKRMGTPNYISPEQARGDDGIDIRTDIYSLGATLYHMVTGRVPFEGEGAREVIRKHIDEPLLPPSEVREELDPKIDNIIKKMMKKDPEDRYENPATLRKVLKEYREETERDEGGEEGTSSDASGEDKPSGPSRRFRRRRRFR